MELGRKGYGHEFLAKDSEPSGQWEGGLSEHLTFWGSYQLPTVMCTTHQT